ncbi:MAG: agmatine deiminase family protein [Gammaproteobacteria bacterium]|nr:agmatine deiminase family protein [Gammaproteobacteria bacterium]
MYSPEEINLSAYRMPAEWEPHDATWLAWPKNTETWPEHLNQARRTFLDMISALAAHENVVLLIDQSSHGDLLQNTEFQSLSQERILLHLHPYNDSWIRDAGPIFITSSSESPAILAHDFIFNAWGAKYEPYTEDDRIPELAMNQFGIDVIQHQLVLEGGSIDVNGRGTLITTEQCLLHPNRNPHLNRESIEAELKRCLGIQRILWLGGGIEGDDTDGHVDDITRFVDETTVLTVRENQKNDPNYEPLEENFRRLKQSGDQDGNALTVVDIPMPDIYLEGPFGRSPASYANFLIANQQVLVPVYGAPNEASVLSIFRDLFPERKIVPIDSVGLVCGLGSIHCVTQQQPHVPAS